MATSAQLLKDQSNGAEIRIQHASGTIGAPVTYSPRYKGDREPWVSQEGATLYRYPAKRLVAVSRIDRDAQAEDLAVASAEENEHLEAQEEKKFDTTTLSCGCYAVLAATSHRRICPENKVEARIAELKAARAARKRSAAAATKIRRTVGLKF